MKRIVAGIMAHVDAGKTTLSEAMLYLSGATERLGRVDKKDAYLDHYALERERGITIFSKQAIIKHLDTELTLIDTPGHVDFSCETERTLSIQDYAILLISATDGVTAHTKTLWQLLAARKIPTFIFVNKTDISTRIQREIADELRTTLSPRCVDFTLADSPSFFEEVASLDEGLMAEYFETERLDDEGIVEAIRYRKVFPCYFGSALKLKGVDALLRGLDRFTTETLFSKSLFGARVYKISRDKNGRRMTLARITGGSLCPKDTLEIRTRDGVIVEKVEEIRVYNGDKSQPLKEAKAGAVCAIFGPNSTKAGMGLGIESDDITTLSPPLCYRLILPDNVNPYEVYMKLCVLGEEEPSLSLLWEGEKREIKVCLMGDIQLEVLKHLLKERLGLDAEFDTGEVLYRETVAETVRGAGHFEPLCHYAEVHLEIEPLPEGSGVVAAAECDREILALNWQRLVMTHIEEKSHTGVLTGSPLTDVKITLIGGRAHQKHTEGGDFREATYRAIRQGLRKARSILLEPTFDFRIDLPLSNMGRALTDINNMFGEVKESIVTEDSATLVGSCPVVTMRDYPKVLRAYTHGFGNITLIPGAYVPAHNQEEVIAAKGYNPDLDDKNPCGSVFCKAGAGYGVPWDEADEKMHASPDAESEEVEEGQVPPKARQLRYSGTIEEDKELMRIFEATYGKVKPRKAPEKKENSAPPKEERRAKPKPQGEEVILLDGYNVIHSSDRLKRIAETDFALARDTLIRALCNYTAFKRCKAIIVFDAYRVRDGKGSVEKCGNTTVVYTKERETADAYIERVTYDMAKDKRVRVVTADMQEQFIILGNGALRVSPDEFFAELASAEIEIGEMYQAK